MKPNIQELRAVLYRRTPRGWAVKECGVPKPMRKFDPERKKKEPWKIIAWADFSVREVVCPPVVCPRSLYVAMHEFGHIAMDHEPIFGISPSFELEFEAERWAIEAMRADGIRVPRDVVAEAKAYVRECIDRCPDAAPSKEILKWCDYS